MLRDCGESHAGAIWGLRGQESRGACAAPPVGAMFTKCSRRSRVEEDQEQPPRQRDDKALILLAHEQSVDTEIVSALQLVRKIDAKTPSHLSGLGPEKMSNDRSYR